MMHSLLRVLALAVFFTVASGATPKYASEYEPVSSSNVNGDPSNNNTIVVPETKARWKMPYANIKPEERTIS